jgi:DNA (cytosine-5)-methyltransferase 1
MGAARVNYYNEFDPHAAAWLRELIKAGHIPAGDVDERSIEDVRPDDLRGYHQHHFFAGIGGWAYALRLAGWPDDQRVWTGSCPCQPFSAAGKGTGFDDQRHLWPAWFHLIRECRPAVVFGEQVASAAVGPWLDLVQADMEGMGHAFGSVAFPASGIGAPHIRDRTYWVADSDCGKRDGFTVVRGAERDGKDSGRAQGCSRVDTRRHDGGLAHANGWDASAEREQSRGQQRQQPEDGGALRLADSNGSASGQGRAIDGRRHPGSDAQSRPGLGGDGSPVAGLAGALHGFWRNADWLLCRDGKWRPVEPGTFPLAHGLPARVVRLRGYGNAIVPQQAAEFVKAFCEAA